METNLNRDINSERDAKEYIKELVDNGEIYPLFYNTHYVIWIGVDVSCEERDRLNFLSERCELFIKNPTMYAYEYSSLLNFVENEN